MDLAAGVLLTGVILSLFIPFLRPVIDLSISTSSVVSPFSWFLGGALILSLHAQPKHPTPAFPETGLVIGTGVGLILGMWIHNYFGFPSSVILAREIPAEGVVTFLRETRLIWLVRFLIGASVVLAVRMVNKRVLIYIVNNYVFPSASSKDPPPTSQAQNSKRGVDFYHPHPHAASLRNYNYHTPHFHHPYAEVTVKYFNYISIAIAAPTYIILLFVALGLHVPPDYSPFSSGPSNSLWSS